jgi:multiple antibiotic resistance protein
MAGSYFLGSHLLSFFGVSLPAVQVAGGLVVCVFGWTLLMQKDGDHTPPETVQPRESSQSILSMTLPLTIDPDLFPSPSP